MVEMRGIEPILNASDLIRRRLGHPAASHCSWCRSLLNVGRGKVWPWPGP
ncbi:MAG: hypothetical protein NTV99_11365 [Deltaproteobacteria bacterium]|nr:hypothetical protein [Deltaproteobacteria bacterium]